MVFSIANPFGIAFWGGVGSGLIPAESGVSLTLRLAVLLAGFAVGAIAWCFGMSLLVVTARLFVGQTALRAVHALSSLVLTYFALEMLWTTWHVNLAPAILPHRTPHDVRPRLSTS